MVGSGIGRYDLSQPGERRVEAGPLPEAHDGEVREPRPPLALVDAEPFQALLEIIGEALGPTPGIAQEEHPDAPGLAVALRHEPDRAGGRGGLAQRGEDRLELRHRPVPEEGEGDAQVPARDPAAGPNG